MLHVSNVVFIMFDRNYRKRILSSPWYKASCRTIVRSGCELDRGVNFFVESLERLGAKTLYSCEGHPRGFYIMFDAPYSVAWRVARAGFFTVSIVSNDCHPCRGRWLLELHANDKASAKKTKINKVLSLVWASETWKKDLL